MLIQRRATATRPAARFENLVVTETADEVLLYDTEKHHIHHLNATTAAVWRLCDGRHTVVDLARETGRELGAEVDEATVRLALTKLDDAGLLNESLIDELRVSRMSRRTFMQRVGVAGAIAVPAIVSTTAAVAAFSNAACGEACENRQDCNDPGCPICSGVCQSGVQYCTGIHGYPSHLCGNSSECKDLEHDIPCLNNPSKTCTQKYNCSGGGQVPGVDKGCCVKNTDAGSAGVTTNSQQRVTSDQTQTDPPAQDPPASDPPASDPPVSDPPASDPPVSDPPAQDPPVTDSNAGVDMNAGTGEGDAGDGQ